MDDDELLPWCRATVAGGTVTLNAWNPSLIRGGPATMLLEQLEPREVAVADLLLPAPDELEVRFVPRSPRPEAAVQALLAWAALTGYRRVWLHDRVVDLEPPPEPPGTAEAVCPTCGLAWRDDTAAFWAGVHASGCFPAFCRVCGGSLPEWSAAGARAGLPSARGAQDAGSRTASRRVRR